MSSVVLPAVVVAIVILCAVGYDLIMLLMVDILLIAMQLPACLLVYHLLLFDSVLYMTLT